MNKPLQPSESGVRRCLKCTDEFLSSGAGNRICRKCTQVNSALRVSEAQLIRQRGAKRLNGNSLEMRNAYEMSFF